MSDILDQRNTYETNYNYKYGGDGSDGGIDCSHLVNAMVKDAGYLIPYEATQTLNNGSKYYDSVSSNDVRAGDIIMFDGHTGVVVSYDPITGNGRYFGAQSKDTGLKEVAFGPKAYKLWKNPNGFLRPKAEYKKNAAIDEHAPPPVAPEHPAATPASPLVLDLDGDGIEVLGFSESVHFDHKNDGFRELTGWASSDDGLLVWDKNGDGKITSGDELFGNSTRRINSTFASNGFAALADLDTNFDGKIDASDAQFSVLQVWRDLNTDGITDAGELSGLSEVGVASISLNYLNQTNQVDSNGNYFNQIGNYTTSTGGIRNITDVWFATDSTNTLQEILAVPAEIAALPDAKGFGKSRSLQQAMVRDVSGNLKNLVQQFSASSTRTERLDLIQKIIFAWTGQPEAPITVYTNQGMVSPIDGRKLATLETFYGFNLDTPRGTGQQYAFMYEGYFNDLTDTIFYQLASQTYLASFFNKIEWSQNAITHEWEGDFTKAVASLSQYIHDHPEQAENIGMDFVQSVRGVNPYSTVNPDKLEQQLHAYFNSPDAAFLTADDKQLLNVALQGSDNDIVLGDAQANLLMGLAGNDSLSGGAGNDTLDGGTGDDELKGGSGNNEYRFGVGYGYDRIINQNSSGSIDTIKFMGFVFLKDISFGRSNDDLWISIDGTKDVLIVQDHFNSDLTAHNYINLIKFSDGTSFNIDPDHFSSAAPVAPALQNNYGQVRGTSKSDTITVTASVNGATTSAGVSGGAGDDLISGLASNDVLHGDEGNDSLLGNEGQDSLYGDDGNDQLTGGTGDDALYGGAGNDTYMYNLGDGLDFITRQGLASDTSVIEFGAGISAQNIHVQRIGQDLNIVITAGIDEMRIKDFFDESTGAVILENAINSLKFSNGDIWNIAKIKTEIIAQAATLGSDTIYGFETNDVLSGGKGLDYIYGGSGDDTYQYNRDDDIDFITDAGGADQITLGAGISQTQVNIDRNSSNSLVLTIQGGGSLVVTGSFDPSSAAFYPGTIESVRFADGKVWDLNRIYWETLKIKGGFANDSITGTGGNDTLVGRTGDDQISGGAGDDYYEYALGDGRDTITDSAGQDIISLGDGITQSQVILTADSAKNLVIALPDGGSITVAGEFNAWGGFTPQTIDYIRFADNSIWGLARIKSEVAKNSAKLLSGTAANDTLVGDIGHDTLVGGKGSDQLEGGGGNDTYRFALGDANDVISELAGNDTIEFQAGITQENVIARSDSKNLTLTMSDGATLTVKDMFAPKASVILDSNVSAVINLMETRWIPQAEALIENNYGLTISGDITLKFTHNSAGESINAFVSTDANGTKKIVLTANLDEFMVLPNGAAPLYYDRIIASQMTYAALGYNMDTANLPAWFVSGAAEFITGGDERVKNDLGNFNNQTAFNNLFKTIAGSPGSSAGSAVSYIAVKLLDKEIRGNGGTGIKELFAQLKSGKSLDQSLSELSNAHVGLKSLWSNLVSFESHVKTVGYANIGSLVDLSNSDTGSIAGSDYGNASLDAQAVVPDIDIGAPKHFNLTVLRETANELDSVIETIKFQSGDVWDLAAIKNAAVQGTINSDVIIGFDSDDVINAGKGNDQIAGGAGSDVYKYASGDGDDVITDILGVDRIELGAGITQAQVSVKRDASNNLVLTFVDGGTINVTSAFDATGNFTTNAVESILFNDGSIWDSAKIRDVALNTQGLIVIGTAGGDNLVGGNGNDTFIGGKGLDGLHGEGGNDIYQFNIGDDTDVIYDSIGSNSILLGAGITQQDLKIRRTEAGYEDLVIDIGANGKIIVADMFDTNTGAILSGGINKIQFADNTLWDISRIKQELMNSTAGADLVWGFDSSDTLSGGKGNDSLIGWAGDDTYMINLGDGNDTIIDWAGTDTLQFGADITESQIQVGSGFGGDIDLVLPNNQIVVLNHMADNPSRVIEFVRFANGVVWDAARIKSESYKGSDYADYMNGTSGDDVMRGGKGSDQLTGGKGNDVYQYALGDGKDVIADIEGVDRIELGAGITQAQVSVKRDASNNLVLTFVDGGTITVANAFDSLGNFTANAIEAIKFSDNSAWDLVKLNALSHPVINGTNAHDTLVGTSSNDIFNAGKGDDLIKGLAGNDIYQYSLGDGIDYIEEMAGSDTVKFGSGITENSIAIRRSSSNLLITVNASNRISVLNAFDSTNGSIVATRFLENIQFSDGSTWDLNRIQQELIKATSGNDIIEYSSANDVITGGRGDDVLRGRAGNDTYHFSLGDGVDYIEDDGGVDTIQFGDGILESNLKVRRNSSYLELEISTGERVSVGQFFDYSTGAVIAKNAIESIKFANGGVWDIARIKQEAVKGTNENETIDGFDGDDIIHGAQGHDSLRGGLGNDIYQYALGDGNDILSDYYGSNRIEFAAGINESDVNLLQTADGRLVVDIFSDGSIAVEHPSGLHVIRFDNGTEWDAAKIAQLTVVENTSVTPLVGTSASEILRGTAGKDSITGGLGDDQIFGGADSDTLLGGDGNDSLYGGSADDSLDGGNGHDYLDGGAGYNTVNGGAGNDTLIGGVLNGGLGDDTYKVQNSDSAEITDTGGVDKIELSDIWSPDTIFVRFAEHHPGGTEFIMRTTADWSGSSVEIKNMFGSDGTLKSANAIEQVSFSNGVVWTLQDLLSHATLGSDYNDYLTGFSGGSYIRGGKGNDSLVGAAGDDTYFYDIGDGNDWIWWESGGNDKIQFGAGISAQQLTFERDTGYVLIYIHESQSTNVIGRIQVGAGQIESIAFSDNTSMSLIPVYQSLGFDVVAPNSPTATFDSTGKVISGVAEAGSTVTIKNGANTSVLKSVTADAITGAYTVTLTTALINQEMVNVTSTDFSGNVSLPLTIKAPDKTPPTLTSAAFDTTFGFVKGSAEAGSTITVKKGSVVLATGVTDANGSYNVALPAPLINKEVITISAADAAGNVSTTKTLTAPDKTPPALPTAAFDAVGKVITGVAEAGSTVVVKNSGNTTTLGSVVANASTGAYTITLATALINKETVNVTAKDAAGNVSAIKAIIAPDKTAPALPTAAFDVAGKVITGVAEAGSTVVVKNSGNTTTLGTVTAHASTGAYTVTLATALTKGETVNVTAKDVAGNVSAAKAIIAPKLAAALASQHFMSQKSVDASSQLDSMIQAMAAFAPPAAAESNVLVGVYRDTHPMLVSHS